MPERVCCNTEFLPFRLLREARVLALRITDPDRYRAITALREARRAAQRLAGARDRRAIKACESALHTHMQSSLSGRMRISSRSLLPIVDELFSLLDHAAEALEGVRGGQAPLAGMFGDIAQLIGCLEMQVSASSYSGASLYAGRFIAMASALRDSVREGRRLAMGAEDQAARATVLTSVERLLASVCRCSHASAKSRTRRSSR